MTSKLDLGGCDLLVASQAMRKGEFSPVNLKVQRRCDRRYRIMPKQATGNPQFNPPRGQSSALDDCPLAICYRFIAKTLVIVLVVP